MSLAAKIRAVPSLSALEAVSVTLPKHPLKTLPVSKEMFVTSSTRYKDNYWPPHPNKTDPDLKGVSDPPGYSIQSHKSVSPP